MGLYNNPRVVTDDLVLYIDPLNRRSYKGPPITNLQNNFSTGWVYSGATYNSSLKKLITNTSSVAHFAYVDSTLVSGTTYTQSFIAKKAERCVLQITPSIGFSDYTNGQKYVNFDLSSGTMSGTGVAKAKMKALGDGWYRCSYTDVADVDGAGRFAVAVVPRASSGRLPVYADTANYGIFIEKPQLEISPFASEYTATSRTNTECIFDVAENYTVTANELTYVSEDKFNFDKVNDYITVENGINYSNGFSLEIWFNCADSGENYGRLFDKSSSTSAIDGFGLWFAAQPQRLTFIVNNGANVVTPLDSVLYNVWNSVTATVDSSGSAKIYVNGDLSASGATNLPSTVTTTNPLTIGNRSTVQDRTLNGAVSICKVYQRDLTAQEVIQNFSSHRGRYGI